MVHTAPGAREIKFMKHLNAISHRTAVPARAESILAKSAQIANVISGVVALQEISDFINKEDVHGN